MSEVRTRKCDEPGCGVMGTDVRSVSLSAAGMVKRMDLCPEHSAVIDALADRLGGWKQRTTSARIAAAKERIASQGDVGS